MIELPKDVDLLLDLYAAGPNEEDRDVCRRCDHVMLVEPPACEPSAFCHSCTREFLELLIEKYKRVKQLARSGWNAACHSAQAGNYGIAQAAEKAMKELGDA